MTGLFHLGCQSFFLGSSTGLLSAVLFCLHSSSLTLGMPLFFDTVDDTAFHPGVETAVETFSYVFRVSRSIDASSWGVFKFLKLALY